MPHGIHPPTNLAHKYRVMPRESPSSRLRAPSPPLSRHSPAWINGGITVVLWIIEKCRMNSGLLCMNERGVEN
jgi:hypothetical protein